MPKLETKTAFEFPRGLHLFLNVEVGISGLGAVVGRLGSHPRAKAALTKLRTRSTTIDGSGRPRDNGAAKPPAVVARPKNGTARAPALPAKPRKAGISAREQRLADQNRKLKQELDRVRKSTRSSAAGENTPVFFVVGLAKSGSSWLANTLDSHPEILCKGEGRFFGREWSPADDEQTNNAALPGSFYNALSSSEQLKLWTEWSVWTRDGESDEQLAGLTRAAIDHLLSKTLAETGKKIVGDKALLTSEFASG